jgi:hypothetical protein
MHRVYVSVFVFSAQNEKRVTKKCFTESGQLGLRVTDISDVVEDRRVQGYVREIDCVPSFGLHRKFLKNLGHTRIQEGQEAKFQQRGYDQFLLALFRRTPGSYERDYYTSAIYESWRELRIREDGLA